MEVMKTSYKVKAYSKKELTAAYGVSMKTLKKWLHPLIQSGKIDIKKRIFSPKEVEYIFSEIGEP